MDIFDSSKMLLFVAFFIPGFVSLKAYELLFLSSPKETVSQLNDAITYSCLNYAILFPVIYYASLVKLETLHPIFIALFISLILFVAPVVWVCLFRAIRHSNLLQRWLPHPTSKPWDYVFGNRCPYWVIVTMKNGNKFGGKYGYKSFSSSGSENNQIYLEETWKLNDDGGFERPKHTTAGTLIVSTDIESIEFFHLVFEGES